ncbi:MAG: ABC transporter permease [Halobacteriales archaeon]
MASKQSDRFDQVDWNEITGSAGFGLSINTKLVLLTVLPVALLGIYDWQAVGRRQVVFEELGKDLGLLSAFESLGIAETSLAGLDYLFMMTLSLFAFYLVLPLYQNPRMTKYYWKEFKRNRPAVVSLIWLLIVFVGGVFGPLLMEPPRQEILLAFQPPVGMSVDMNFVPTCAGEVSGGMCHGTWEYPLGTTRGGKGVFTSIVYGMTVSMQIAFITTTIVAAIGVTWGTVAAYAGGWVDEILFRYVDIQQSFPSFILYILVLYIFGGGLALFIILFGLFSWGGTARYVRSKALSIAEEEYVKAIGISGASGFRIIRKHVIPNTASSIITQLTLLVPGFLLFEAGLSFLELGDIQVPTWGKLIASGKDYLQFAPWIILAPGFVLFLTILAFNFLGDAMLDALNPKAEAEAEK